MGTAYSYSLFIRQHPSSTHSIDCSRSLLCFSRHNYWAFPVMSQKSQWIKDVANLRFSTFSWELGPPRSPRGPLTLWGDAWRSSVSRNAVLLCSNSQLPWTKAANAHCLSSREWILKWPSSIKALCLLPTHFSPTKLLYGARAPINNRPTYK